MPLLKPRSVRSVQRSFHSTSNGVSLHRKVDARLHNLGKKTEVMTPKLKALIEPQVRASRAALFRARTDYYEGLLVHAAATGASKKVIAEINSKLAYYSKGPKK